MSEYQPRPNWLGWLLLGALLLTILGSLVAMALLVSDPAFQ